MVFEAHGMSFPCTELLLFNYAKVNTVFHSMAPLKTQCTVCLIVFLFYFLNYFLFFISCKLSERLVFG